MTDAEKFADLDAAFRRYRARTDAEIERLRGENERLRMRVPLNEAALTPEGTQVIGPMHPYPKEDTGMATRLPAPEGTQGGNDDDA